MLLLLLLRVLGLLLRLLMVLLLLRGLLRVEVLLTMLCRLLNQLIELGLSHLDHGQFAHLRVPNYGRLRQKLLLEP